MSETKFTKGPWVYDDDDLHGCRVIEMNGYVTMSNEAYYPYNPENQYDWCLMAAAPEMYEALEDARKMLAIFIDNGSLKPSRHDQAVNKIIAIDALLAKARGEK